MKKFLLILIAIVLTFSLISCDKKKEKDISEDLTEDNSKNDEDPVKIVIKLTNGMVINAELYPDIAPITVENFLKLVDEKFYDGLIFHRIIASFMIQGGGFYLEDSKYITPKEAKTIKGEFKSNGVENNLKHELGVLSMARATDKNSASSQFFICVGNCSHLDGDYAAFGKVTDQESLNNVIALSNYSTAYINSNFTNFPYPDLVVIESIRRA